MVAAHNIQLQQHRRLPWQSKAMTDHLPQIISPAPATTQLQHHVRMSNDTLEGAKGVRTEETAGLCSVNGELSGREATSQVATGRGTKDRMTAMIDVMTDMMYEMRNVLTRQNRVEVERSLSRPLYRAAKEV
ncbi:hypothetical protein ACLOJK_028879 [Asimina triloba]